MAVAVVGWWLGRRLNRVLGWLFERFDAGFRRAASGYTWLVGRFLRRWALPAYIAATDLMRWLRS